MDGVARLTAYIYDLCTLSGSWIPWTGRACMHGPSDHITHPGLRWWCGVCFGASGISWRWRSKNRIGQDEARWKHHLWLPVASVMKRTAAAALSSGSRVTQITPPAWSAALQLPVGGLEAAKRRARTVGAERGRRQPAPSGSSYIVLGIGLFRFNFFIGPFFLPHRSRAATRSIPNNEWEASSYLYLLLLNS
jgi:hypothetical protein